MPRVTHELGDPSAAGAVATRMSPGPSLASCPGSGAWIVALGLVLGACRASDRHAARESTSEVEGEPGSADPPSLPPAHEAVGPTSSLSPELRAALADTPHFSPIPEPQPGDWLSSHPESGQTLAQFLGSAPNVPGAPRETIYLLPIGEFGGEGSPPLAVLEDYTHAFFGLEIQRLPTISVDSLEAEAREHHGHRQLHASSVLAGLQKVLPDDAYCLIGLTMEDLYPDEKWNYVFGYASVTERVGVYSFARYDPAFFGEPRPPGVETLILRRSLHVMSHEIGHMFGLQHCVHYSCNMNGTNSLEEADRQSSHLCPVCLRKLHATTGLDPVARYEALGAFYRAHELRTEAAWTSTRLDYIRAHSPRLERDSPR